MRTFFRKISVSNPGSHLAVLEFGDRPCLTQICNLYTALSISYQRSVSTTERIVHCNGMAFAEQTFRCEVQWSVPDLGAMD